MGNRSAAERWLRTASVEDAQRVLRRVQERFQEQADELIGRAATARPAAAVLPFSRRNGPRIDTAAVYAARGARAVVEDAPAPPAPRATARPRSFAQLAREYYSGAGSDSGQVVIGTSARGGAR